MSVTVPAFAGNEDDLQIISQIPPLPADLDNRSADQPASYQEVSPVGTARPSDQEIKAAYELLINSPYGVPPVDIAEYFLAVGAGAYGAEYRQFAREWPVRANPLIFHFFSSTQTKPEGDTTAWCAAFINWCLLRSRAKSNDEIGKSPSTFSISGTPFPSENLRSYSTNNASSGSFRCWQQTNNPARGDIVVFRDIGTENLTKVCRGSGHVAFFLKAVSHGRSQVLGGNQTLPGSNGAITVANMRTGDSGRFMKFVSLKSA